MSRHRPARPTYDITTLPFPFGIKDTAMGDRKQPTPPPVLPKNTRRLTMRDQLGRKARDRITAFTGRIVGHVEYISGCNQVLLSAEAKDGKVGESAWVDEQRVELLGLAEDRIVLDNSRTPGPDMAAPIR